MNEPNFKNIQALFFDFDGVIIDSLPIKAEAFVSLFSREDIAVQLKVKDYFIKYTGHSRQEKIAECYRIFLHKEASTAEIDHLSELFSTRCLKAVIGCPEIAGATNLLKNIPPSIKKFVVSGTPEAELLTIVEARALSPYFDQVKGTPVRKEDNIAQLLTQYDLSPDNCIMIGDGEVDQLAADANDLNFIGVVSGDLPDPFSSETMKVSNMRELAALWL